MNPPSSTPAPSRSIVAVALAIALTASCFLLGAVWTVHSEARDAASRGPTPQAHSKTKTKATSYFFDDADDFSYAVVEPGSNTTIGSTRDGDRRSLRRLIESRDQDALWFSIEDENYVVTDAATVERARDLVAPLVEHGRRQGELGAQQGRLGAKQARIGAQQAKVGARQAALAVRQARGAVRGRDDADQAQQSEIDRAMEELGRMQEELSAMQEPLARRQEEMGRRQEELGHQMEEQSARARRDMRRLCEHAIRDGLAERAR